MNTNDLHLTTLFTALLEARTAQDELNKRLHPRWDQFRYPFLRAAWKEAAECLDHLNWAWWKTEDYQKPLKPAQEKQIRLELVDIFHFLLCDQLQAEKGRHGEESIRLQNTHMTLSMFMHAGGVDGMKGESVDPWSANTPLEAYLEDFIRLLLPAPGSSTRDIPRDKIMQAFVQLCTAAKLSLDDLLIYYFAKRELNEFRWTHGYAEGTYRKRWTVLGESMEDNEYLSRIMDQLRDQYGSELLRQLIGLRPASIKIAVELETMYKAQV